MVDASPVDDLPAAGRAALARGAWSRAYSLFAESLAEAESPEAYEGLSWAVWWLEDAAACIDAREHAYRLYRRSGRTRDAARMALWLGDDHNEFRGAAAVAEGWLRRAARLLEEVESSPEHGWLAVFEAYSALGRSDLGEAERLARRARDLGRRHRAVDLEMFALAVEGATRIEGGDVTEGMRCLDEAVAAALADEYENLAPAAWSCCLLMSACEQVRDYERGAQWCARVGEFSRRMDARFLTGVCRAHYGALLMARGGWEESERELVAAAASLTAERPSWRAEALVRLGELRRRQGHPAEAARLFEEVSEHPGAQRGMAALHVDRGEPAAARDLLERMLRRIPAGHVTGRADALELLVHAEAALGEYDSAAARAAELRSIAASAPTGPLNAAVHFCFGLVAAGRGETTEACRRFEDAADGFARAGMRFEAGRVRAELAGVLHTLGKIEAAAREAEAARRDLARSGASSGAERARSPVRRLESAAAEKGVLTARQVEVLRRVAEGMSDRQIAAALVLSEHTVHRHVANIYTRLGCSSRAAAVARAERLGLL